MAITNKSIGEQLYPLLLSQAFGPHEQVQRQELRNLQPMVASMRKGYHQGATIDYSSAEFHKAHLIVVYPHHVPLIYKVLQDTVEASDLVKASMQIALIGGGAAPEVIGFARYAYQNSSKLKQLHVHVIDLYDWSREQQITREVAKSLWPGLDVQMYKHVIGFDNVDFLDNRTVISVLSKANLIIIQNVLSDITHPKRQKALDNTFSLLKLMHTDSFIAIIDTPKRQMDQCISDVREKALAQGFIISRDLKLESTLTSIPTPPIVKEELLTGQSLLNPRANVRTLSIVLQKKAIQTSSKPPVVSNSGYLDTLKQLEMLCERLNDQNFISYISPHINEEMLADLILINYQTSTVYIADVITHISAGEIDDLLSRTENIKHLFRTRPEILRYFEHRPAETQIIWQPVIICPNKEQVHSDDLHDISKCLYIDIEKLKNPIEFTFKLKRANTHTVSQRMPDPLLSALRGLFDPDLLLAQQDQLIGVITQVQEELIRRSLKHLQNQDQQSLFDEAKAFQEHDVLLIRGVAGSGKTIVLIERAKWLAQKYPNAKILILTFNDALFGKLRGDFQDYENIEVQKFYTKAISIGENHRKKGQRQNVAKWLEKWFSQELDELKCASSFIQREFEWRWELGLDDEAYIKTNRRGRRKPLPRSHREKINQLHSKYLLRLESENVYDWERDHRPALEKLSSGHPSYQHYDAVLIDEGQDFAPSWFEIVKRMLKPEGHLFIAYDSSQSIFRNYTWKDKGIEARGRTKELKIPFRNTYQIALAAFSVLPVEEATEDEAKIAPILDSSRIDKNRPQLRLFKTSQQAEDFLHQAIITMRKTADSSQIVILPETDPTLFDRKIAKSINQVKGMEYNTVLFHRVDEYFKLEDDAEEIEIALKKVHMGITRARKNLIITCVGDLPKPLFPLLNHCEVIQAF